MQYLSRSFLAILAALLVAGATGGTAFAKTPARSSALKKPKKENAKVEASFSAIDENNTEISDDESNFASAKPEKHRALAAQEDPVSAMAQAIRQSTSPQHRNTSIGNSQDLQPFTDFEIPR